MRYRTLVTCLAVVSFLLLIGVGYVFWHDSRISITNLTIANQTDTAVTIAWQSDQKYSGKIFYQQGSSWSGLAARYLGKIGHDERDLAVNKASKKQTHIVTLKDLKPDTTYSFRVGGLFNGKAATTKTFKTIKLREKLTTPEPAYGQLEGLKNTTDALLLVWHSQKTASKLAIYPNVKNQTYTFDLNFFNQPGIKATDLEVNLWDGEKIYRDISYAYPTLKPLPKIVISTGNLSGAVFTQVSAQTNPKAVMADWSCPGTGLFAEAQVINTFTCHWCEAGPARWRFEAGCGQERVEWGLQGADCQTYANLAKGSASYITEACLGAANPSARAVTFPSSASLDKSLLNQAPPVGSDPGEQGNPPANSTNAQVYTAPSTINQEPVEATAPPVQQLTNSPRPVTDSGWQQTVCQAKAANPNRVSSIGITGDSLVAPFNLREATARYGRPGATIDYPRENGNALTAAIINDPARIRYLLVAFGINDCNIQGNNLEASGAGSWGEKAYELTSALEAAGIVPIMSTLTPIDWAKTYHCKFPYRNSGQDVYQKMNQTIVEFARLHGYPLRVVYGAGSLGNISSLTPVQPAGDYLSAAATIDGVHFDSKGADGRYYDKTGVVSEESAVMNELNSYTMQLVSAMEAQTCPGVLPSASELLVPVSGSRAAGNFKLHNPLVTGAQAQQQNELRVAESGVYSFFKDGTKVAQQEVVTDGKTVTIRLFNDINANGIKEAGEEVIQDLSNYKLNQEEKTLLYRLNSGWNLIHIPLIVKSNSERGFTASELAENWARQSASLTHVAIFNGGQFSIYTNREGVREFANNFTLVPGNGVFVFNQGASLEVKLNGQEAEAAIPLTLNNGWNLLGVVSEQNYSTESWLQFLTAQGLTVSVVARYENGRYLSVVRDQGVTFGNNYNLAPTSGYFLKVDAGGSKTITP